MSEMSLKAVREKLERHPLINLGEVNVCSLDQREECELADCAGLFQLICTKMRQLEECKLTDCAGCNLVLPMPIEVKVDDIYSTRRSFLLDSFGLEFSIVISKTADFKPPEVAELSDTLAEQLKNLALEKLDDPKIFYVRTWQEETTRRHPNGWRFVKFVEKTEHANALLIFTRWEHLPSEWLLSGTVERYHDTIGAFECGAVDASAEIDDHNFGYEYWLFQYDPKADRLRIPSDPAEDKIDTFLHRQEIYAQMQPIKQQYWQTLTRKMAVNKAIVDLSACERLSNELSYISAISNCVAAMPESKFAQLAKETAANRDMTQKILLETKSVIEKSDFSDWDMVQLEAESAQLEQTLNELEDKISDYLTMLKVDSESESDS